jgi:hypothetical protein
MVHFYKWHFGAPLETIAGGGHGPPPGPPPSHHATVTLAFSPSFLLLYSLKTSSKTPNFSYFKTNNDFALWKANKYTK